MDEKQKQEIANQIIDEFKIRGIKTIGVGMNAAIIKVIDLIEERFTEEWYAGKDSYIKSLRAGYESRIITLESKITELKAGNKN